MKNNAFIIQIVLGIAIVGLYILHFTKTTPPPSKTEKNTDDNFTGIQVAYIATDSLYAYYNFYKNLLNEFQDKQQKAQIQLQNRLRKLEDEGISYQKRAQAGLMSQNDIQKAEQDFARKQQELQSYQQTVSAGLAEEEQVLNKRILKNITDFLKEYTKEHNYDIILNYTPGNVLWHVGETLDITQDVLDGLNEAYGQQENNTEEINKSEKEDN